MSSSSTTNLDTSLIKDWRSIVTLIVFVVTNIVVLFPFHIPIPLPRALLNAITRALVACRIVPPKHRLARHDSKQTLNDDGDDAGAAQGFWLQCKFPMNFMTAPLVADLFLLAILAIGRDEVYGGTIDSDGIQPIDIMLFFITLAYIAISIDASGLIRWLAFKVLQKGGKAGHKLFFYLYAFFFGLGSIMGNDPIILSGTAFLAYMTRVSSNIVHPRAWIHAQFAIANIASAILVSSNPTNLVLAGAFKIKFVDYTKNMIVPVVVTAIALFPFLLYLIFNDEDLIPSSIQMHELPEEAKNKTPVNPNIPNARGNAQEEENRHVSDDQGKLLSLEEIMNPFLDKGGAAFGAVIMLATLATILGINASSQSTGKHPVFYVTVPAAFVMFCWDLGFGWINRHKTREIARKGREEIKEARRERALKDQQEAKQGNHSTNLEKVQHVAANGDQKAFAPNGLPTDIVQHNTPSPGASGSNTEEDEVAASAEKGEYELADQNSNPGGLFHMKTMSRGTKDHLKTPSQQEMQISQAEIPQERATLVSLCSELYSWSQETFPTVTAVVAHLPFALVPFAFCMFILVQALVTKGWVPVFAYGWDHWVNKTGTVGSIGGMAFLSVILCNFAGTNIGTTILLSRVLQAWALIHEQPGSPSISDRTFWASVYGMALGVNYGAFSTAFSASLAGLLWRDILARKHITVKSLDFARVNLPIIAIAMTVGCAVLTGEIYITRGDQPYSLGD